MEDGSHRRRQLGASCASRLRVSSSMSEYRCAKASSLRCLRCVCYLCLSFVSDDDVIVL